MNKAQNKIFFVIVMGEFVSDIFDIVSSLTNVQPQLVPEYARDAFNVMFLLSHNFMPFFFVAYVSVVSGDYLKRKAPYFCLLFIPLSLDIIALGLNAQLRWIFYYDENGYYCHDYMMVWLYISAFFYIGYSIWLVIKNNKAMQKQKWHAILFFVIASALSIVYQIFHSEMLVEMFFQSIGFLGMLFTLENEDELRNPITGACNRHAFLIDNQLYMESKVAYQIISVKITNLATYNNTIGVPIVNAVLQDIATRMAEDVAKGNDSTVYDCEHGIFHILLLNSDEKEANRILDVLTENFGKEWKFKDFNLVMRARIEYIRVPEDVDNLQRLLSITEAEEFALSNNKLEVIRGMDLLNLKRETEVISAIKRAIDRNGFQIYYQPIFHEKTGRINSAEALVRLFDEEIGFVPPDEFIPIAERNGMIVEVGVQVFRKVCEDISTMDMDKLGLDYIEVNLSTIQCMNSDLPASFRNILKRYKVDAKRINLEITESAAVNNPDMLLNVMSRLREIGFDFSLDDYGTGYSNFTYMFDMNFDIIKLDKSILYNADRDKKADVILRNSIRMLKEMNFQVLVEGIETDRHRSMVEDLGVDLLQGYYFSRPLPRDVFLDYVENFKVEELEG
ncbi:MAG: EAL domain-containing protein [Lachnospiraceae bacterium]|nr:EAL domain-containing protein [Lachnospiraceae bacterium]